MSLFSIKREVKYLSKSEKAFTSKLYSLKTDDLLEEVEKRYAELSKNFWGCMDAYALYVNKKVPYEEFDKKIIAYENKRRKLFFLLSVFWYKIYVKKEKLTVISNKSKKN